MLVKPLFFNYVEGISQEISPTQDTVALAQLTLNGINGVGLNANGQRIVGTVAPSDPLDAANKAYVDSVAQGLNLKFSCVAMGSSNITSLSGTMTVDGVALAIGDRVLLTGQVNQTQNGIWVVQSGAWTRPADFNTGAHAATSYTFIEQGTNYAENGFVCITDHPNDVIDTNNINFTQFTGAGEIIPGSGITKSGNTLSVLLAASSGLQFTSGALDHYLKTNGGLFKDGTGLSVLLKDAGTATATLLSAATGLSVLGLPNLFTVNGVATISTVTAAALNTLTASPDSQADGLHTHASVISAKVTGDKHTTGSALSAGDPVAWSSTASQLVKGDAGVDANARIIGLALGGAAANATATIVKRGVAKGVLTGASAGAPVYLGLGGGLVFTQPTGSALRLVRMGWAVNATDLEVSIYDMGKRSV